MHAGFALFRKIYFVFLTLATSMAGTHLFLNRDTIFPDAETVVVYGRDSCSITALMIADLERSGVPYLYRNVDRFLVSHEMWYHLDRSKAPDDDATLAEFPVVVVNGHTLERAIQQQVIALYRQANVAIDENDARPPAPSQEGAIPLVLTHRANKQ
ncbi:MAG TPA: hypothetical protein VGD45_14210 [Steroidobacter sp.]|uniref:hypothetical protein n=1 Tax=Steroidobacter sp. TaxID=1978227 RepID=UPI002EDB468C